MADDSIARVVARYAVSAGASDLPAAVKAETVRTFTNFFGCAIGGAASEIVDVADRSLAPLSGPPQATLLARKRRADPLHAALINCLASSVFAYDDTYADTILHPGGPVAAAILALTETRAVSGEEFILACALGLEVECRLSLAVAAPPARGNIAWSQTGITGGAGAAVAAGKLMGLNEQQMAHAIGIAGAQASGYRALHATMCTPYMPANAAQTGLRSAYLANGGFGAIDNSLEHRFGFLNVYAAEPNPSALTESLGEDFKLLRNTYKPFPCGIVIYGIVDSCLEISARSGFDAKQIDRVSIVASPETLALTAHRRHPDTLLDGQLSLHHWAAVSLIDGAAGIDQGTVARLRGTDVATLRGRIEASADEALTRDQARVTVHMRDGSQLSQTTLQYRGSVSRPLTDEQLGVKFLSEAGRNLSPTIARDLLDRCVNLATSRDVGAIAKAAA